LRRHEFADSNRVWRDSHGKPVGALAAGSREKRDVGNQAATCAALLL
jgi:hypothetical protein